MLYALLLLLLFAGPARADFEEDLAQQSAKDAEAAGARAQAVLKNPLEQTPDEWIPAWLYLWDLESLSPDQKKPELIARLLRVAQERRNQTWTLRLRYALNPADASILKEAEDKDAFRVVVVILSHMARDAYNAGQLKESLLLIQKAAKTLQNRVPHDDLLHMTVLSNMAIYLEYSGAPKQAEELYLDLIQMCRTHDWLHNRAEVQVGYALLLMHQKRFVETEALLNDTMHLANALHSDMLRAHTYKSLGFARAGQQHYRAAIDAYEHALEIFGRIEIDPVGVSDTHRLLADMYRAEKQWDKALIQLDKAASLTPMLQDKIWENEIQEIRLAAYIGLGRLADALQISGRINELLKSILQEEKQKELSKLKVAMGLEIEEQKNAVLKQQNAAQRDKLREADLIRSFFIGLTALGIIVIMLLLVTLRQTLRAKRSRERTHRILQHIEEGILSIGPGLKVQDDFSPYLKHLLDESAEHENIFLKLLHSSTQSADERARILSILQACIGESLLAWELNSTQLPQEILLHHDDRHLLLDWQPVFHDAQIVESILLTVRDISDRKRLQIEVEEARAMHQRHEQRLGDVLRLHAQGARKFASEANQLFDSIRQQQRAVGQQHLIAEQQRAADQQPLIAQQQKAADQQPLIAQQQRAAGQQHLIAQQQRAAGQQHLIAQQLHTLKGLARSFGFKDLSTLVHELEGTGGNAGSWDALGEMIQDYSTLIRKVFPGEAMAAQEALIDCVSPHLPSLRTALKQAGLSLGRIAVIDDLDEWPKEWLAAAQVFCLHGLTNALEHGFILPQRKGETVRPTMQVHIRARLLGQRMELELSDNGRGLDWDQLRQLAARMDFKPGPHQSLADVVFEAGASTATAVSERSGRGLGMSAVKQAVQQAQGSVQLLPNENGQGSRLVASFPLASTLPAQSVS